MFSIPLVTIALLIIEHMPQNLGLILAIVVISGISIFAIEVCVLFIAFALGFREIDLSLSINYTRISATTGTRIDYAAFMASISPLPSSTAGLGNTIGTLGERADGGSFSTVRLSSLPWQDVIHGTNTYMYDSRYYASSRVFNKSGTIKVDTTYLNNNSVYLANNTKTISISANH